MTPTMILPVRPPWWAGLVLSAQDETGRPLDARSPVAAAGLWWPARPRRAKRFGSGVYPARPSHHQGPNSPFSISRVSSRVWPVLDSWRFQKSDHRLAGSCYRQDSMAAICCFPAHSSRPGPNAWQTHRDSSSHPPTPLTTGVDQPSLVWPRKLSPQAWASIGNNPSTLRQSSVHLQSTFRAHPECEGRPWAGARRPVPAPGGVVDS